MDPHYDIAIVGAYVRNAQEISAAREAFVDAGMAVVFPEDMDDFALEEFDGQESDYVVLTPDSYGTRDRFEQDVFDAIARADVVYCCNPHGSLDRLSAAAAGYAVALGKQLYAAEAVEDGPLRQFLNGTGSAAEVVAALQDGSGYPLDMVQEHSPLPELQRYMTAASSYRDIEEPHILLERMADDVAALADRVAAEDDAVADEAGEHLALFLAGILALANAYDVDLAQAFREREAELF